MQTRMSEKIVTLHKDVLFVGLTRVPMVLGIPYAAFVAEVMFMSIEHVMTSKPRIKTRFSSAWTKPFVPS